MRPLPRIAIIIPCNNEQAALPLTLPVLLGVLDTMATQGIASSDSYLMCVDDGSTDSTWQIISDARNADSRIHGISLVANAGQQNATIAALDTVRGHCDAAVTIDCDLQDDPQAIIRMVEQYRQGAEIVYGVRSSRQADPWFKRVSARTFYRIQRAMGLHTVYDHSEFRLMSSLVIDMLADYGERNLFIRGIMPSLGLPSAVVTYPRTPRTAGTSKYSTSKLMDLSIDGITSFTARPMRLIFMIGVALLLIDIAVAVWVFTSYFRHVSISGWASLMLSVWFLGSLILMALGIVGEYIGKIFIEVKHRPRYMIGRRTDTIE